MTVSTEVDHNEYTGNGVTTNFDYTFRIFEKSDLVVVTSDLDENQKTLILDTDYTVTGAGTYQGGRVVLSAPLADGWRISIARELPVTQETDLRNQGRFFAEVHEDAFDKLTMLIQQVFSSFRLALRKPSWIANYYDALNNYIRNLRDPVRPQDAATKNYVDGVASGNINRTLRVPEKFIPPLPSASQRANKIVAMDSNGNPIMVLPESGSAADVLIELAKPSGAELIGVQPSGNLQQMLYWLTPEQFGALRDGDNDDAIAINAALNAAESVGGGVVQLSEGSYFIESTIFVPQNCTLKGAGIFSTVITCMDSMDKSLNSITSKNNPLYPYGAGTDHPTWTDYEYIHGVVIEDLCVDANHLGRDPDRSGLTTTVQACGIKLTSVTKSRISRCAVKYALLHGFDVAASNYFNDGDYTHNIDGGSVDVLVDNCYGMNTLYDDVFTCHNSSRITFKDCYALNDGTDPNMLWENNQNGFEIDEGCFDILVDNCYAEYFIAGFQAKGHDETMPARNVTFRNCFAHRCAWSYQIEHMGRDKGVLARGVSLVNCTSSQVFNDRYIPSSSYRARNLWLRGYDGITVDQFTVIGGDGLIELDSMVNSVTIDGVKWFGGYSGEYSGTTNAGLINVVSDQTIGRHTIKNIRVVDPVSVPVVRCVDNTLTSGVMIENITASGGDSSIPCVFATLNIPATISGVNSDGFSCAVRDSAGGNGWRDYGEDLSFRIDNGIATIRTPDVPTGSLHPPRVGNLAVSRTTGKFYSVIGTSPNSAGTWSLVGAQS